MALYNNGFPATYSQYYAPVQPVQQPPQQNGIIWVQGEAAAKSYLVAPNNTVQLWDSENQTIYLKSADASGMPNIRILDYTIRETSRNAQSPASVATGNNSITYATKGEIEAVTSEIEALREKVDKLSRSKRVEGKDNE